MAEVSEGLDDASNCWWVKLYDVVKNKPCEGLPRESMQELIYADVVKTFKITDYDLCQRCAESLTPVQLQA